MKKLGFLFVLSALFLASCGSKNDKEGKVTSDLATKETQKVTYSSHSTTTETSSLETTPTQTSTTSNVSDSTISEVPSSETTNIETSTTFSATDSSSSESTTTTIDPLSGYTNEQIEYARVWLAVMGTQYKTDLANANFELHVTHAPAGKAINPYDTNSLTFPNDTITLSGSYGYQSLVVYSSNHNGSITRYAVPSHFQQNPENQELLRKQEQDILANATIVNIPVGNPEDVKELINVMKIDS